MTVPFERTICDCAQDQDRCRSGPGHLIPSDLPRLATYLKERNVDVSKTLQQGRGALVMNTKTMQTYRIPTITPSMRDDGSCVFFEAGRCTVHPVAPFGCAYFDVHMDATEGHVRSMWGLHAIVNDPSYQAVRSRLPG